MKDVLNNWIHQQKESNAETALISQLLQKQQLLQKGYEEQHSQEQAILLSLHQLGARFSLSEPRKQKSWDKRMLVLLVSQIILSQIPTLLGYPLGDATSAFYALNVSFFMFFFLAIAMAKTKKLLFSYLTVLGILAVLTNLQLIFKFPSTSQTFPLMLIHLIFVGLLSIAFLLPYQSYAERFDHVTRFLGELFLLTFLVSCLLGVVMLLSILLFETLGLSIEDELARVFATALLPSLPLFCYQLLKSKQASLSYLTKLLAKLALPLFIILTTSFLIVLIFGNIAIEEDRNLLLFLDSLLALTLIVILLNANPQHNTMVRMLILFAALLGIILDAIALGAILSRFMRYGFSPNRLAVLALNILLLANLSMLMIPMLRKVSHAKLQAVFFSLHGVWFLFVVIGFGPLFGYR